MISLQWRREAGEWLHWYLHFQFGMFMLFIYVRIEWMRVLLFAHLFYTAVRWYKHSECSRHSRYRLGATVRVCACIFQDFVMDNLPDVCVCVSATYVTDSACIWRCCTKKETYSPSVKPRTMSSFCRSRMLRIELWLSSPSLTYHARISITFSFFLPFSVSLSHYSLIKISPIQIFRRGCWYILLHLNTRHTFLTFYSYCFFLLLCVIFSAFYSEVHRWWLQMCLEAVNLLLTTKFMTSLVRI